MRNDRSSDPPRRLLFKTSSFPLFYDWHKNRQLVLPLFWIELKPWGGVIHFWDVKNRDELSVVGLASQTLGDWFFLWYVTRRTSLWTNMAWTFRALVIDLFKPHASWNKHFDQLCKLISEQSKLLVKSDACNPSDDGSFRVISRATALAEEKQEYNSGTKQTFLYRSSDILDNYSAGTCDEYFSDRIYDKLRRGWAWTW